MQRFQRILFLLVALVLLLLLLTAVVQAQDTTADTDGCIYGQIWQDENQDGRQSRREHAMGGVGVLLLEIEPFQYQTGPYRVIAYQLTDEGGEYAFCKLKTGSYEVRAMPAANADGVKAMLVSGSNPAGPIQFQKGGAVEVDFGFRYRSIFHSDDTLNP